MNTQTLISEAKARFNHNLAKQYLKDKYQVKLIVANQGGLWKASPELMVFLDNEGSEELVLLDLYENPIKVNRPQLASTIRDTYNSVMQDWYNEWSILEKKR